MPRGNSLGFFMIYIELNLRYQPPDSSSGTWVEEDFVYLTKDRTTEWLRVKELDKKSAALGRKLAKGLETDEEEEEEEDFYDTSETGALGTIFSPVKSISKPMQLAMDKQEEGVIYMCIAKHCLRRASKSVQVCIETALYMCILVGINVIEAQKLVGVNINPFVVVKVGEEKRHTATQKSTNCSFYNEECDMGRGCNSASSFSDHRFFQKWAVISDPMDTQAGVKGFVKCSISVSARGDIVGFLPTYSRNQDEDIKKNLLLPKRFPAERPWARVCIKLYRAEGLSSMRAGIMGGISKIIGEKKVFIDPYVQVSFCGQQGETSVETTTTEPEWNEQISFVEMFPPLSRKIKVQVLDDASVRDVAIATHYIDVQEISETDRSDLNEGMGEGIFYRGHILMAITVEIFSSPSAAERKLGYSIRDALRKRKLKKKSKKSKEKTKELSQLQGEGEAGSSQEAKQPREVTVEVEELHPLPEEDCQASGNYGKSEEDVIKGWQKVEKEEVKEERQPLLDAGSGGELDAEILTPVLAALNRSVKKSHRPEPMEYDKQYSLSAERKTMAHPNNRDRCRTKYLMHNIAVLWWLTEIRYSWKLSPLAEYILYAKEGLCVRRHLTQDNVKEKVKETRRILAKIRFMAKEPQCTLPDVLIWMLSNNRRVAYARIPAQNILYSVVEEEKGKDCAKIQTVFMKVPGLHTGEIFAKLEIYMWLGVTKYAKNCLAELPEEFLSEREQEIAQLSAYSPPSWLSRDDFSYFQLRAHLYQARGILPADDNGLSDPFARVVFSAHCQTTRMLEETLSPMGNELLFDHLIIDGKKEELKTETPIIIINLFSHNKFGSPDFLGQAFAVPQVKLVDEPYTKPALQFFNFYRGSIAAGELIATFELIELDYSGHLEPSVPEDVEPKEPSCLEDPHAGRVIIPEGIRPVLKEFRIEILFWGLRDLKRVNLFEVDEPQVIIECAGKKVESKVIVSYKENPNFTELVKYMDVDPPEQIYLHPPLSIFVVEKSAFGRTVLVGSHVMSDVMKFSSRGLEEEPENVPKACNVSSHRLPSETVVNIGLAAGDPGSITQPLIFVKAPLKKIPINKLVKKEDEYEEEKPELEELDWWSKYYASQKELYNQACSDEEDAGNDDLNDADGKKRPKITIYLFQIYNSELEHEFGNFEDRLCIFPLHRGKANEDEDGNENEHYVGSFYVYPTEEAATEPKVSQGIPRNRPIKVLVRVYIVKATNLSPADPNGKADSYVVVTVGKQQKDTKEQYIPKQLNPVFGEVVELAVSFPMESELTVAILDHDLVGSDDLIGETKTDLENRFYSKHRANCGVAAQYDLNGYNMWRDAFKPTQILDCLCKKNSIPAAEYRWEEIKVDNKIFKIPPEAFPEEASVRNKRGVADENLLVDVEHKALYVLQHWEEMPGYGYKLVPEHVEIQSLYNPENPGLVQLNGSLHMWIDMFPNNVPAPPPVNIKPRLPVSYELRVIIWNTDNVILDDVNPVTGEPSSNIYVKSYLPAEKITYKKKDSIFSMEESEFQEPAVLVLQVCDYECSSIKLKMHDMVWAAKSSEHCTLKMAKENATPRFSIFRNKDQEDDKREEREYKKKKKKTKWSSSVKPEDMEFIDSSGNKYFLMGKVEAEFQLLTVEEADKSPVGLGRKGPEPLEKPNWPKTTFSWFVNPMKTFVFFIWKRYKRYIIVLFVVSVLTIFLVLLVYTMPGYISEKIING
ncbi:fer-1-like protein 4 [Taeniopygia guttata]|uniref:fer-1-like protein 4 n=1 Tax=Taeniopygia guttata TaxID=59729 RepID=UPI003BB9708C